MSNETPESPEALQNLLRGPFHLQEDESQWFRRLRQYADDSEIGCVGEYELIGEVGRGGQGVVFKARQPGTGRIIAIKRLTAGLLSGREAQARFEREIEAASALDHPNIVTVFGAEVIAGQQLLAMKWIDGVPIDQWASGDEGEQRGAEQILGLFVQVCDAIHHAHQRGVIHRDLKPSNILVDRDSQPQVLDFGLAKLQRDNLQTATITLSGAFLGTPTYAAPEQIRGDVRAIDVRTDVYALGAILYRLLLGQPPFVETGDLSKFIQGILHQLPATPSTLNGRLNREIDAILFKALAKEKEVRYQSVEALGDDIRRYLAGQTVLAHTPSKAYRLRKFVRQHRTGVATTMVIALLLVAGTVVSTAMFLRGETLRRSAESEAYKAQQTGTFLAGILSSANRRTQQGNPNVTVREVLDQSAADLDSGQVKYDPAVEASVRRTIGETYKELGLYPSAEANLLRAIKLYRSATPPNLYEAGQCMDKLGSVYRAQGRVDEAAHMLEGSIDSLRSLSKAGDEFVALAIAQQSLGVLKRRQGKFAEAEALYLEARPIYHKHLGPDDDNVWVLERSIAWLYYAWGRPEKAEPIMRAALEHMQHIHPEPNYDVATMQWQLGMILFDRGDLEQNAEELIRQGLQTTVKVMGPNHPLSCSPKHFLARFLVAKGRPDEAIPLYLEIVSNGAGEQVLGYAEELVEQVIGRMEWTGQAEEVLRGALKKHQPLLGPTHSTIAGVEHRLGRLLLEEEKYLEAESFLSASEEAFLTDAASRTTELCDVRGTLAELYERWAKEPGEAGLADRAIRYKRLLDSLE